MFVGHIRQRWVQKLAEPCWGRATVGGDAARKAIMVRGRHPSHADRKLEVVPGGVPRALARSVALAASKRTKWAASHATVPGLPGLSRQETLAAMGLEESSLAELVADLQACKARRAAKKAGPAGPGPPCSESEPAL